MVLGRASAVVVANVVDHFAVVRQGSRVSELDLTLIDAPSVVGWERWRQIDEAHSFGVVKAGLRAAAKRNLLPAKLIEPMGHILLAALNELALLIVTADDPEQTERDALKALDHLLKQLLSDPHRHK